MLTASAPIAPLGWTMFVELPVKEAYASLYQALQRLALEEMRQASRPVAMLPDELRQLAVRRHAGRS